MDASPRRTAEMISSLVGERYKYGFVTDIESETAPKGLNEEIIRYISAKKGEPAWLLEWRLKAYRHWLTMPEPGWANVAFRPSTTRMRTTIRRRRPRLEAPPTARSIPS